MTKDSPSKAIGGLRALALGSAILASGAGAPSCGPFTGLPVNPPCAQGSGNCEGGLNDQQHFCSVGGASCGALGPTKIYLVYWGRWDFDKGDDPGNLKDQLAEVARSAVGSSYLTPIDQYRDIPSNEFGADINVFFTNTVDPNGTLAPYSPEGYDCQSEQFGGGNWKHYPSVLKLLPPASS